MRDVKVTTPNELYIKYLNEQNIIECHPLGLGLRLIRKHNNLTLQEVATYLGINRNTLSSYEKGTTSIPLNVFVQLIDLYDVKVEIE